MVRTTVIAKILKDDLDTYCFLRNLKIKANHFLNYLEPGVFKDMSRLEELSISFNRGLKYIYKGSFEGLRKLKTLVLVNNGFTSVASLTPLLKPFILPSLEELDISENPLISISNNDFSPMEGSTLKSLKIELSSLEFIHRDSFLPLKMLNELYISQNNLNSSLVGNFLLSMHSNSIKLKIIDLSGMGFRKQPPRNLMNIIAMSTVTRLLLADNHFEVIADDTFPKMANIQELDLSRVSALKIGPNAFDSIKFPNLEVLLLSGNNLHGIYQISRPSYHLLVLDLSSNRDRISGQYYYTIDKNSFLNFRELRVLNLAYNEIKSIYDYTFKGLEKLRVLNLENSSIYFANEGTFKAMLHLNVLNLANNPLGKVVNLTGNIFDGLSELKVLSLKNCGIANFYESDNLFEKMPNITTLILRNNRLRYLAAEILLPLKKLEILDLRNNILVSWSKPLFLTYGVRPSSVYLSNNKITQFTASMLLDVNYLLGNHTNDSVIIDFTSNVIDCDCSYMYKTYSWLEINGSIPLKEYFYNSNLLCNSPDVWEDQRVSKFLAAIPTLGCPASVKTFITHLLVWSAPTLIIIVLVILTAAVMWKYRVYISYWMFISKVALGRKFIKKSLKPQISQQKGYTYDAFVSYSNEDKEFVAKLISHLESTPPQLKLCIYERDFEIGSFISESVSNSINESRYIILIISNNFAKSQWCRWETQLAEYHRLFLENGTSYDPLVLIKIGDIESKYMTTTLKYLLKTKIYHLWNEQQSDEFWIKLKKVLTKD